MATPRSVHVTAQAPAAAPPCSSPEPVLPPEEPVRPSLCPGSRPRTRHIAPRPCPPSTRLPRAPRLRPPQPRLRRPRRPPRRSRGPRQHGDGRASPAPAAPAPPGPRPRRRRPQHGTLRPPLIPAGARRGRLAAVPEGVEPHAGIPDSVGHHVHLLQEPRHVVALPVCAFRQAAVRAFGCACARVWAGWRSDPGGCAPRIVGECCAQCLLAECCAQSFGRVLSAVSRGGVLYAAPLNAPVLSTLDSRATPAPTACPSAPPPRHWPRSPPSPSRMPSLPRCIGEDTAKGADGASLSDTEIGSSSSTASWPSADTT